VIAAATQLNATITPITKRQIIAMLPDCLDAESKATKPVFRQITNLSRWIVLLAIVVNVGARRKPMDTIAAILFGVLVAYVAIGLIAGLGFIAVGVVRVQAAPVTLGARILLLPGATALWPLVLARWLAARRIP
jgi:hypothetical protein